MKFEIRRRWSDAVIYSADGETLRDVVTRAVDVRADLRGAYLRGADLRGARGLNPKRIQPLHMLADQVGPIRAYKLVTKEGRSPIAGTVGAQVLTYEIGATLEVAEVDTDPDEDCGRGLHVATLPWVLAGYRTDRHRVLLVEFAAADIACIPHDPSGQFRVRRLTVIREVTEDEMGVTAEREARAAYEAERAKEVQP